MALALSCVALHGGEPRRTRAISGQFSARFESFSETGQPRVRLKLMLASTLKCPPSDPKLTFGVAGVEVFFISDPREKPGVLGPEFAADLREDGVVDAVVTFLPPGSQVSARVRGATCQCGSRTGEGGAIDLHAQLVVIPPWVSFNGPLQAGSSATLTITAKPKGAETIEVKVSGAGLDLTKKFTAADFDRRTSVTWRVTPTAAGTLTTLAKMGGGAASHTRTFEVRERR